MAPDATTRRWCLALTYLTVVTVTAWTVLGTYALAADGFTLTLALYLAVGAAITTRAQARLRRRALTRRSTAQHDITDHHRARQTAARSTR